MHRDLGANGSKWGKTIRDSEVQGWTPKSLFLLLGIWFQPQPPGSALGTEEGLVGNRGKGSSNAAPNLMSVR